MMSYIIQTLSKTCNKAKKQKTIRKLSVGRSQEARALVKSRRKAPTPEWENIQVDTNVKEEDFGEIARESTYAGEGSVQMW